MGNKSKIIVKMKGDRFLPVAIGEII